MELGGQGWFLGLGNGLFVSKIGFRRAGNGSGERGMEAGDVGSVSGAGRGADEGNGAGKLLEGKMLRVKKKY